MALWKALRDHDECHPSGQKFTTTLFRFVDWECQRKLQELIRERKRRKAERVWSEGISDDHVWELREVLTLLEEPERILLEEYFFQDLTLQEMALARNRSIEGVRQQILRCLTTLRELLGVFP